MPFNHARAQKQAHKLIARWGGKGQLVRAGVTRDATMAVLDFKPNERSLLEEGEEVIRVSAYQLTVPPNFELDTIVFGGSTFRIYKPITGPRPNNLVIYYDCNCLKVA